MDYTKAIYLEIVVAYLIGKVADKACSYYNKGEGFFYKYIVVLDIRNLTFFDGDYTNYIVISYSIYFLVEF